MSFSYDALDTLVLLSVRTATNYRHDITVQITHGFLWWKRTKVYTFRGSLTVWHDIETGYRPGTLMEMTLSAIEWKFKEGLLDRRE